MTGTVVRLCPAGEEKNLWSSNSDSSIEFCIPRQHRPQVMWKERVCTRTFRQIHSVVLETLKYRSRIYTHTVEVKFKTIAVLPSSDLFEKVLYAVAAGCKTEQERIHMSEQVFHFPSLEWQRKKMTKITACEYQCNYWIVPHIIMQNRSIHKLT